MIPEQRSTESDAPPRNRSSLISRLAASTALLAAGVVFLAIVFFELIHGSLFQAAFESPLQEWSAMMAGRIVENPAMAPAVARAHKIGIIINKGGTRTAFGPSGQMDPDHLLKQVSGNRRIDVRLDLDTEISVFLERNQFDRRHVTLLAGLIAMLLIIIGVTYAVQLSQLRPLQWLRSGVDAVSRGDFTTRVPVVRQDEIGQVGQAFNQMTRRVEQMMNDRERLLADVSHELLSPLARIKVALELLPESEKRDAIKRDIREMQSLTSVLLERERVRNRADRLKTEPVDLAILVQEARRGFDDSAIKNADLPGGLLVQGDKALIKILIHNLLDNAVKFSLPDSKPVSVQLGSEDNHVVLIVEDDGQGIPAEEARRVLEPFVKLNPARGHRAGYGLGLNLCQRIVHAHEGTIELSPRQGRGCRVVVKLPISISDYL